MNIIRKNIKIIQILLIGLTFISFFLGFFLRENSAGGGGYSGDFQHTWKNLITFKNNSIKNAIKFTGKVDSNNPSNVNTNSYFQGTRPPLIYILQSYNPFVKSQSSYFLSVFIISIISYLIFLKALNQIYEENSEIINRQNKNLTIVLLSCLLLLSPYFRTSAYWALEENYGILTMLITLYFLKKFNKKKNTKDIHIPLFNIIFFSSVTLYFDQKFLIIPLIVFFSITYSEISIKLKVFSVLLFCILSLPYLYLIKTWGNVIPANDAMQREVGRSFHYENISYAIMLLGFYLFPFINWNKSFKDLYVKFNLYFALFIITNLIFFIFFYDLNNEIFLGKGIFFKASVYLFDNIQLRKIFLTIILICSSIVFILFVNQSFRRLITLSYFLILSFFIWPYFQEYLDPIILILTLLLFPQKFLINKNISIYIFLYFLFFLVGSNIYYYSIL